MKDIADRLKFIRGDTSQQKFGELLGIPQRKLSRFETAIAPLDLYSTQKICKTLNINAHWLLFGEGPMKQNEADSQEQKIAQAPPLGEPPRARHDESLKLANERLYQALEGQLVMQKQIGELKAENAALKERIIAREQEIRNMQDLYELQELDVGSGNTSANTAPAKSSTAIRPSTSK